MRPKVVVEEGDLCAAREAANLLVVSDYCQWSREWRILGDPLGIETASLKRGGRVHAAASGLAWRQTTTTEGQITALNETAKVNIDRIVCLP